MQPGQSNLNQTPARRRVLASAGGVMILGAAVLGGRAWGQSTPAGSGAALAAGPIVASATGTSWVTQVAQAARSSVVSIDVSGQAQSSGRLRSTQTAAGSGTGVLLDSQGDILTNNHVVTLDSSTTSAAIQVVLGNGKSTTAQVVGQDPATDLAVIRVSAGDVAGLTPIQWADTSAVQVGEPVVAIGYALDLGGEPSVTTGVVSAINRQIEEPAATISGAVQTDAAVNPGNSGGPLLDQSGHVIGINTAGLAGTSQQPASGINFAVSAQTAQPVVQALLKGGTVTRGYIGVSVSNVSPQTAPQNGQSVTSGAQVQQVGSGSPAAQAGLQTGDIITKVGDVTITNAGDLSTALASYGPGTTTTISFTRGSNQQTVQLTLGQRTSA